MAIFTDNWLFDLLSLTTALTVVFISYVKWCHKYWDRKGIESIPPTFLVGNAGPVFAQKESFSAFTLRLYKCLREKNVRFGGSYSTIVPIFIPTDPELIKHMMQNDFEHFVDRGMYLNEEGDPLSAHLFSLEGAKWKNLRQKLSPTFTSGKMKMMFETLAKCGDQLQEEMDKTAGKESLNIKDILMRFTTDIIGSCAFGIDCHSLKNPDNEFNRKGKLFFDGPNWWFVLSLLTFLMPNVMRKLNTPAVYPELSKFFSRVVKDTVDYREKNNIYRKDFMHLLLQLKNRGELSNDEKIVLENENGNHKKDTLTLDEIAAQAFIFFLAGYETSSTTMTFCLYELATNPDIQEKLRQEVKDVLKKHDNKLTYDAVNDMHYMEKVVNETLRKYPPFPGLNRVCTKDYKIPGTDITIEKGTAAYIPVIGLQHDEAYYPNPEKFDPERFSEENKRSRHHYTFLPFGEGPRICIGLRFGMMQTKVGLTVLLNNYRFSLSPKTKVPLKMNPKSFISSTDGGVWLDYTKT